MRPNAPPPPPSPPPPPHLQGYEDRKRHDSDRRENARPVMRLCDGQVPCYSAIQICEFILTLGQQWQEYTWAQLRVSDLIRIHNGETFPAGSYSEFF